MKRSEHGRGTVRTVRNRQGVITGYQALLPRELSTPPEGCKNPERYQEPFGPVQPTEGAARALLDAAIVNLLKKETLQHGLTFAHYVESELKARLHQAKRKYENDARAAKAVSTWRSIDKCWLRAASFYDYPPSAIDLKLELQPFFTYLTEEAEKKDGDPLSADFIHNVARFCRAVFERAGVSPNPAESLQLPDKQDPKVPHLDLAAQRRFFRAESVDLEDRTMAGCGTGAGLRVGELLSLEVPDLRLDDHDPHLIVRYGGPHHGPPKGGRLRRVDLFEPGLGFFRLWMERFYLGKALVFGGRQGGYQKAWPELFPRWADAAGVPRFHSHMMRHTYAVSVLSGSWGYEPKGLDFVQQQLGHSDRQTTEKYYGAFEHGTWQREVRLMRGRVDAIRREPVTALELLGIDAAVDAAGGAEGPFLRAIGDPRDHSPSVTPHLTEDSKNRGLEEADASLDAATHQAHVDRIERALRALADRDPTAVAQAIAALGEERRFHLDRLGRILESIARASAGTGGRS